MIGNKVGGGRALRIVVGITALVLLLSGGAGALSNSGGGSWQYYREITISNSGGALSDYQVFVNLSGADFPTNANASGADIRFTDASGNELSYWIEGWDYDNRSAKVWVNVTSVPAGASAMIRMWYGNPSATSSSNGNATFEFFDDFNDLSKWTVGSGTWSIVNGEAKHSAGSGGWDNIQRTESINNGILETRFRLINSSTLHHELGLFVRGTSVWDTTMIQCIIRIEDGNIWYDDYNVISETISVNTSYDKYYREIFILNNANVSVIWDRLGNFTHTTTHTTQTLIGFRAANSESYIDWIFLRKYASQEPSVSVGAEQSASPLLQKIWQTNLSSTNLLWPAVGDLNGDGIKDVITGTNTRIYALNGANGQTIWTYDFGSIWGLTWPTVKDVDGDGKIEVMVGLAETSSRTSPGKVIVLNNQGQVKWMYNLSVPPQEIAADDIDGDGKTEVIFGLGAPGPYGSVPGYVYVVNGTNGSFLWSFAGHNGHQMSRVMTGDLNGDGIKEIIAGDWGWESPGSYVYAINGVTHNTIWSYWADTDVFPITVEDMNNDNKPDLIFSHNTGTSTISVINGADGTRMWGYSQSGYAFWSVAGDINGAGKKEVISRHSTPSNAVLRIFNGTTGSILWSYTSSDNEYGYPSISDVNSDGVNEVIAAFYNLTVFRGSDGSILQEIPLSAAGKTTLSEDLNGDGNKEVVAIDTSGNVYLFAKSALADITPPASITSLHNITYAPNHINWTWTDPSNSDFSKAMIYLDGSFQTNVTKGVQYYNATGLTAGSTHTIATRTVDTSGNINLTRVNHTATTLYLGGGGGLTGDVNRNGIRDTGDATLILRNIVDLPIPSESLPILPIGDMNCNGIIDTGDATLILRDVVSLDISRCWE
ncbi:Uncharacterised protein [uncultured archaeon]|nr:Uncharacterised protein [uncultured archaeon]